MTQDKMIPVFREIEQKIYHVRDQKVMLDSDLAELYGVEVRRLNEQVKRNRDRFPIDFMFRLAPDEYEILRSQIATSKSERGGRRYLPYVFTEHGAIMLASVLNSTRAIEASIYVVRAFVRMREIITSHKDLARKLEELEKRVAGHDEDIRNLVMAIRQLMPSPPGKKRKIGFEGEGK